MKTDHIHFGRGMIRIVAGLGLVGAIAVVVAVVPGWSRKEEEPPKAATTRPAARLVVPEGEVRFSQWQRTTKGLPGAGEKVQLSIGDVTGGRVKLSIAVAGGEVLVEERAASEGDEVGFALDARKYQIVVDELRNSLIGEDEVVFVLREVGTETQRSLSEEEKIERLIAAVKELKGATFIRNGGEHSAADAVEHMRRKWENGKGRIRTAREFIQFAASRSSLSGEAYRIRFADGKEVTAEAFFRKELEKIEGTGATTRAATDRR